MDFLVLEMREESGYADSAAGYEFPRRYLSQFSNAGVGTPVLIYEPRRNQGRKAYVAWAVLAGAPAAQSEGLYRVQFQHGLRSFDCPVPFEVDGVPAEHRLRGVDRRRWSALLQGRAVRWMPGENAVEILTLGHPLTSDGWQQMGALGLSPGERQSVLVQRLERDSLFRDRILRMYDFRCALTGLACGPNPASRLAGLLDVAHLQPVAHSGPDVAGNGVVLTPTAHRMFDAGLFTFVRRSSDWVVRTSPRLHPTMRESQRMSIRIEDGMPLLRPATPDGEPDGEFMAYHRKRIFQAA